MIGPIFTVDSGVFLINALVVSEPLKSGLQKFGLRN